MNKYRPLVVLISIAVLLLSSSAAHACPTCKEGISENSMNLVRGFGWSIIFMMSMPFLVLGGIGGYFYLEIRRARQNPASQSSNARHWLLEN